MCTLNLTLDIQLCMLKYVLKVNIVHPNAAVEVLKLTKLFIPCFDFLKYKMMIY